MINIIHCITTISRGGAENHLIEIIKGQLNLGFKISVVYLIGDGYWKETLEKHGVDVYYLNLKYYGQIRPILTLKDIINDIKPNILHAHLPPAELYSRLALLLINKKNIPFLISRHNDEPYFRGPGKAILCKWVSKRACNIIAISEAVKNYFTKKTSHANESKFRIIHYGINPDNFLNPNYSNIAILKKEYALENKYLIGTIARFVPQKALDVLIHGYNEYKKIASIPSKLILIGNGPLYKEITDLTESLNLKDDILFMGFREDIVDLLNIIDVFSLTSVYEGFGLVLLEAMAAGKPIVASRVSAIPEIVLNDITGILVTPRDPSELAKAFKKLEKSELRIKFGINARERVIINFTLEKMISETISLYNNILLNQ